MAAHLGIVVAVIITLTGEIAADFDLHSENGGNYEFVYHEATNLLLTVHGNSCFYSQVDPGLHEEIMQGNVLWQLQNQIQSIIEAKDSPLKHNTSLQTVRATFRDILADYRCEQDNIFLIWLDYLACDFQRHQSLCGWHFNLRHSLQWRLHRGATLTLLTGPDHDHTMGTQEGQYLYLEANVGREGEVAEIVSPVLPPTDTLCLRFWYIMHGRDVGLLTVYTQQVVEDNHNVTLWQTSGNQGNVWKMAEVTVPVPGNLPARIYLRGTRGRDIYGDIAIDDVSSMPGVCGPHSA